MKTINTRYGSSVDILVNSTDETATTASLYVGLDGKLPKITKTSAFVSGQADLTLLPAETEIPLGTYSYQINVEYSDGRLKKFPEPNQCTDELPSFIVSEALDEIEVVS